METQRPISQHGNLISSSASRESHLEIVKVAMILIRMFLFIFSEDMYAQDSIDLLTNSGIQFKKHEEEGIDPIDFAELLMTSGIVLLDNIKWLSFHSGYDFGYLLKVLTDQNLPADESEFFELLRIYFPTIYDVKYLMKSCKNLKGELIFYINLESIFKNIFISSRWLTGGC